MSKLRSLWLCCSSAALLSVAVDALGAGPQAVDPRVDRLNLQMTRQGFGRLTLQLNDSERRRLTASGQNSLTLALNASEAPVVFRDNGQGIDLKANDGLFSGEIPVNIEQLQRLNAEAAQLKTRTISKLIPGTRESIGQEQLPTVAIDIPGLQAGRNILLPRLAEFGPILALGATSSTVINPQKSLLIRALPVIEDPTRTNNPCGTIASNNPLKKWTFGYLMNEMAQGSGFTASDFTEKWLNHWRAQQKIFDSTGTILLDDINNNALANIDAMVINPWRQRSGGGPLNLSIAPFRLQAIIYRPDLAVSSPYTGGLGNNGGELRFVFGLMEARDQNHDGDALDVGDTCQITEMAVIFEYGVPISDCNGIKDWANKWIALSALLPGSPAYNGQLEALTEAVVKHGAAPTKPNQNALNQLRTNEIDLTGIWQMREFRLATGGGLLRQSTTANNPREHQAAFTSVPGQTPVPINLNGTPLLLSEITGHLTDIVNNVYSVPETSGGLPFKGGASSYNFGTFWDHPALATPQELQARFNFSLNTCSGCHTGETDTTFYHIRPMGPGSSPILSNFLLNNPHNVVDNRGIPHSFTEMDNRKQALSNLANQQCRFGGLPPFQILRAPLINVH